MKNLTFIGVLTLFVKAVYASYIPSDDTALTVHFNDNDGLISVRTHWAGPKCEAICSYRVRINTYGYGEQVVVAFGEQEGGLSSSNYKVDPGKRYLVEVCRVDSVGGHVVATNDGHMLPLKSHLHVHYNNQLVRNVGIMLRRIGKKAIEAATPKPDCEYRKCLPMGTDYPCSDISAEQAQVSGFDAVFLTEVEL